jgi:hypothetical protein
VQPSNKSPYIDNRASHQDQGRPRRRRPFCLSLVAIFWTYFTRTPGPHPDAKQNDSEASQTGLQFTTNNCWCRPHASMILDELHWDWCWSTEMQVGMLNDVRNLRLKPAHRPISVTLSFAVCLAPEFLGAWLSE